MSYFDKFIKDLEKRKEKKIAQHRELAQSEEAHSIRHRVKLYSERWQNSVRHLRRGKNEKS